MKVFVEIDGFVEFLGDVFFDVMLRFFDCYIVKGMFNKLFVEGKFVVEFD